MPEKICSICSRKISLSRHPSGLVFADKHFVCEDCCKAHSDEDMMEWTKTVMALPGSGMPIALWLVHEQNKDKPLMTIKKL